MGTNPAGTVSIVLLIIVLLGTLALRVEGQLPFNFVTFGHEISGTTPPKISIKSPLNNTDSSQKVYIDIHITKPMLPAPLNSTYNGIIYYCIQIDDKIISTWYLNTYTGHGPLGGVQAGLPEYDYSHEINVSGGKHRLYVSSSGIAFAESGAFLMKSNSTTYFTIQPAATPVPSNIRNPTPTVPEFSWLAILPLLASTLAVALLLKERQVKKP